MAYIFCKVSEEYLEISNGIVLVSASVRIDASRQGGGGVYL